MPKNLVLRLRLGGLRNGAGKIWRLLAGSIGLCSRWLSVISRKAVWEIVAKLSMSHLLEPKVWLQLVLLDPEAHRRDKLFDKPSIPKIPRGFSDVFVYGRSPKFNAKLAKMENSKIKLLSEQKTARLWVGKLVKE